MSMDDVLVVLDNFKQELEVFNDNLKLSFEELEKQHDHVAPLWQDEMQKEYDGKWQPLQEKMDQYLKAGGQGYVEGLIQKIEAAKRYLHGA